MSLPIKGRLTLWYVALLAVILVSFGAFLFLRTRADLVGGVDQSLDVRAAQISLGYQGPGQSNFQDVSDASLSRLAPGEYAAQILTGGAVQDATGDTAVAQHPMIAPSSLSQVDAGQRVRQSVTLGPDGERFRVLAVRLGRSPGSDILVVASSLESVDASVHRLLVLILGGIPVALLAAGLGGWVLARKALRPVARMTSEAEEIGADRLDDRIAVPTSSDELQRLARTLNAMLDRLQEGVDGQRRFVADASHDLRTPLTIMRSEIDVGLEVQHLSADAARAVLVSNRDEIERMAAMVDDLLTLASLEDGQVALRSAPVELRDLVCGVVAELGPLAAADGIQVRVEGERADTLGDRERLTQVIRNLVDNAVKYSTQGSDVRVSVWERSGEAGFTVADTGPGIPAAAVPHVFDRFFRVDGSRSGARRGSGLGLAISREIVVAHGGRIWVESREGSGSSFSVALEAAPAFPQS